MFQALYKHLRGKSPWLNKRTAQIAKADRALSKAQDMEVWGDVMIFPVQQFDNNGGDRVLFSVFQDGLLSVLKGGSVPALAAFRVAQLGENPATGEFLLPPSSCTLTIKLVQCSLFNSWGIQLPEKMGAGVMYDAVMTL